MIPLSPWIIFIIIYTVAKSLREITKKKALGLNSVPEVLFFYALTAFILIIPFSGNIFAITIKQLLFVFIKSFFIFMAWACAFNSIKKLPVGLYGIMDMGRLLCSMLLAITVLGETLSLRQVVGLILIITGLLAVNIGKPSNGEKASLKYVILMSISCLFNSVSGIMDKVITKTLDVGIMQFWYMLFLVILYGIYLFATEKKISFKSVKNNYWILILSVLFAIADRLLFIANADPGSQVTVMSAIKQTSVFVTIVLGRIIFKEKNFWFRFACASVVVAGAIISTL